jgi:hypothetical protein
MTQNRTTRDPDVARLFAEAVTVRKAIEATPKNERAGNLLDYPRECCDHGMKLLALHLSSPGFTALMRAKGERPKAMKFHVWLECGGIILDITADQFAKSYRQVIVTRRSRWHDARKPEREPIAEESLKRWRESDLDVYKAYRNIFARMLRIGAKENSLA